MVATAYAESMEAPRRVMLLLAESSLLGAGAGCDGADVPWLFLAPMLVVVGLGALAAVSLIVAGFAGLAIAGPLGHLARRSRRSRALRREKAELSRGRWAVLTELAPRAGALTRIGLELGPVVPLARDRWLVGCLDQTQVVLCHRGRERRVLMEDLDLSVAGWLALLEETLAERTTDPVLSRPIDGMADLAAAIEESNEFLAEPVGLFEDWTVSDGADRTDVLALARPRAPYPIVTRPEKPVLERRFAAFCELHGADLGLEDMEDLFPHARAARRWLAASRLATTARNEAEEEPEQLYVDGDRYLVVRFSFDEPWVIEEFPNGAAYLFHVLLRPVLEEFRRHHTLRGLDRFPAE